MSSMSIFIALVLFIPSLFLAINFLFAPHNPYQEKRSIFECGYHSFLGQNRTQFFVQFYMLAFLFLIFDLEITLFLPYANSAKNNGIYGLIIMFILVVIILIGFGFEWGKDALSLTSRQTTANPMKDDLTYKKLSNSIDSDFSLSYSEDSNPEDSYSLDMNPKDLNPQDSKP